MDNPYYEKIKQFGLCRREDKTYSVPWDERDRLTLIYSWAIPDENAISCIQKYGPIIEIGAGKGYWASLISQKAEVVAFDSAVKTNRYTDNKEKFFPVKKISDKNLNEILERHSEKTLFLCWPPYNTPMAFKCLYSFKGDVFIYVGETSGGCTGSDSFHCLLEQEWELVEKLEIPKYKSIHDYLFVYKRKIK